MVNRTPKVSIITAVYNRRETIGDAVNSLRRQDYPDWEQIIIDGASTDGTLQRLESVADSRTRIVSEPDQGIYDALNKGLKRADGEIIGLLHSDDMFADSGVISRVVQCFLTQAVDGVYGDLDYVAKSDPNRIIRRWRSGEYQQKRLKRGWMPPHPTLFLRRQVIEQWGGYNTDYRIAADYEAMLRYLVQGQISLAYLPQVLVKMRLGGESNRSLERIWRKSSEDYRALQTHQVGGVGTLLLKNFSKLGQFF
ncbi:glycosyltransferase [Ectothiorhodospiraceae bacterium BW-2]|nr:glycosyltransferase [Ectothiorhodospiraceae bacterium BW-2]